MKPHNSRSKNAAGNDRALAKSLERLRETIALDVSGREREWAEAVGTAIDAVEITLRQHKATAKDAEGSLSEVDETRPTLSRQADEVRHDLGDLLQDIVSLRKEVFRAAVAFNPNVDSADGAQPGAVVDLGEIRQQAEKVLNCLQQTREAEINLVQESVNTDIGVGD